MAMVNYNYRHSHDHDDYYESSKELKKIVTDAVVLALTQCPDCGSKNVNFNPLDDSKYICKDCGKWFD